MQALETQPPVAPSCRGLVQGDWPGSGESTLHPNVKTQAHHISTYTKAMRVLFCGPRDHMWLLERLWNLQLSQLSVPGDYLSIHTACIWRQNHGPGGPLTSSTSS